MINPIKTLKWKHNTMSKQSKLKHYVPSMASKKLFCFIAIDKLRNKSILYFPILSCKSLKALHSCKLSSGGGRK